MEVSTKQKLTIMTHHDLLYIGDTVDVVTIASFIGNKEKMF